MESSKVTGLYAQGIVVAYGGVRAVDGVSFSADAGMVTGLIGPNGAGKSSLLSVIAGSVRPRRGSVWWREQDITHLSTYRRARIGIVRTFQVPRMFPRLSVLENVLAGNGAGVDEGLARAFFARGRWMREEALARERALGLLASFGMLTHAEVRASELSGGQRRIVEYLRVLMARPSVVLLDEPTVGLAPWVVERLAQELGQLKAEGVCVVLVGHEMGFVRRVCDIVVVMASGKAIATGGFDDVAQIEAVQRAYLGGKEVESV